jgi:hypothetical protein
MVGGQDSVSVLAYHARTDRRTDGRGHARTERVLLLPMAHRRRQQRVPLAQQVTVTPTRAAGACARRRLLLVQLLLIARARPDRERTPPFARQPRVRPPLSLRAGVPAEAPPATL